MTKRILAIALALLASAALIFGASFIRPANNEEGRYTLRMGTFVSPSAVESDKASSTVTAVAVITDASGKIVDCVIDCGDYSISFDDVLAKKNGTYLTKGELGDDYNMLAYSDAQWEWYAQADYFSRYVEGMDARKAALIDLSPDGSGASADITAGCTIGVSEFKSALVKAMGDSLYVSFESESEPALSLALINKDSFSEADEENGSYPFKMTTSLCATAMADGKVLAAVTDIAETSLAYGSDGKVSSASYGGTKREMLDGYNMRGNSDIGAEWYEQADHFCEFIVGMTADEIAAIEMTEQGKGADADLTAGCTVAVGGFVEIAAKAAGAAE
ncbi:MAG: hypothetical protein IJD22_04260 [Clostridia bacterium]|nr:hypothetical protein [Clostridia bacterium]